MDHPFTLFYYVCGAIGGLAATYWAIYSSWKKVTGKDEEKLEHIRQELIRNLETNCEAWKIKYESEHEEHKTYRIYAHDKLNESQTLLLKITEENQDLKAKTNIVPIMDALKNVVQTLERVSKVMERLENRLDAIEKPKD